MADKDLYVVIAEMLRKQDQQSEILERIDSTLQEFMGLTLKQFEQQQTFNENLLFTQNKIGNVLERMADRLQGFETHLDGLKNQSEKINTNVQFIDKRLSRIEDKLL